MSEQQQAMVWTKKKVAAVVIAALAAVGALLDAADADASQPEQPKTVAAATSKPVGVCDAKKGQEPVPNWAKPLCVVVAAQPAYETPRTGSPKGTVLVAECRKEAWSEHLEWGRKHAQEYVTGCLTNEHEMWWDWQAVLTKAHAKKK